MIATVDDQGVCGDAAQIVHDLYLAHYRDLVRLARVLVDDPASAEEVVQEAFAATWQHWDRLRDQRDPLAYVRRCVLNMARSRLRRRRTRRLWLAQEAAQPRDERRLDADCVESAVLAHGASSAVREALQSLSTRQRECVVLRHLADCSLAETAALLGISEGAVKTHTHRGLHALADLLAEVR